MKKLFLMTVLFALVLLSCTNNTVLSSDKKDAHHSDFIRLKHLNGKIDTINYTYVEPISFKYSILNNQLGYYIDSYFHGVEITLYTYNDIDSAWVISRTTQSQVKEVKEINN